MKILVLNSGSSSLKFHLFETSPEAIHEDSDKLLGKGNVERVSDMANALQSAFEQLEPALQGAPVEAVGHRFVHGGDTFFSSVVIDAGVEEQLHALEALAPLHMPHNLAAYTAAKAHLPDAKQVAVFDTAFHHAMPPHAYRYAIPEKYLTEKHIRRFGFHGTSHRYVTWRYAQIQSKVSGVAKTRADYRMISCHLGNGCSIAAVAGGHSIDTSMGFTPLEGLVMGTRSGDIDPGAVLHLIIREKEDPAILEKVLNEQSGLQGLSGLSNDMRDLEKAAGQGHAGAQLAIDVFCYRLKKYIGSYFAAMNGVDTLIFTGGIGENGTAVRRQVCSGMSALGIELDDALNVQASGGEMRIGKGSVDVWVVPTDEELLIARDTLRCILGIPHQS